MAQPVTIARHDKRKHLVVAIRPRKSQRSYEATPALEARLREAKGAKEQDCPADFFTEPLID